MHSIITDWVNGDILKAQCFQRMYSTLEASISKTMLSQPYNYGIDEILMDTSGLDLIKLTRLVAVFPDGTVVNQDCNIECRLPEINSGYVYVTLSKKGSLSRYRQTVSEVADWHDQYDIASIKTLEYKLELIASTQPPLSCVYLPIAKLNTINVLDTNYVYPVIFLNQKTCNLLLEFVRFLREKLNILRNHLAFFTLLQLMLLLDSVLHTEGTRPLEVYRILTQIYARSCAFHIDAELPQIIPYNHLDIYTTFLNIIKLVHENMRTILSVKSIIFEPITSAHFTLQLKSEYRFRENFLALTMEFTEGVSSAHMSDWIANAIIEDQRLSASMQRVLGAPRGIVRKIAEFGLNERTNLIVLLIGIDNLYLQSNTMIHISNPSKLDAPIAIKLYYV